MARQSISSLVNEPYTEVCGVYRACNPANRVAKNQIPYQVMKLADTSGQINGYVWMNTYKGYCPGDNDIIRIVGKTKVCPTNGSLVVDIRTAELASRAEENPISLLPPRPGTNSEDIQQLMELIEDLTSPSLKKFLYLTFSNDSITFPFIVGASSLSWHHSEQGGNLRHSLECARFVSQCNELPQHERELGIVGALLHDIGKIRMGYNSQGYSTPTIHHDALTLEILAEPLRMLDKEWRDGASMLRQIWTNVLTKNKNNFRKHVPVVVNLVWFADSLSAATYKENSAFSSSPEWKRYSRLQDVSFWRPSADNYMDRAA